MKIVILSLFLSVVSLVGYSQCKSVKTSTDKFTKKEQKTASITVGSINMFTGGTKWLLEFVQEDGQTHLKANIAMKGEYNQIFDEATQMYLLLDNDNVVKVANAVSAKPVTKVISGNGVVHVFTTYTLTFPLSKEDLQGLSSAHMIDLKVEVPDQKIKSPSISSKDGKQVRTISGCLLETAK